MASAGRRQKVTDEDVFAAAQRVMSRVGPHELTLADIAGEAGRMFVAPRAVDLERIYALIAGRLVCAEPGG